MPCCEARQGLPGGGQGTLQPRDGLLARLQVSTLGVVQVTVAAGIIQAGHRLDVEGVGDIEVGIGALDGAASLTTLQDGRPVGGRSAGGAHRAASAASSSASLSMSESGTRRSARPNACTYPARASERGTRRPRITDRTGETDTQEP
jgi:hypothetical protein